jgi:hypothetical protein
VVWNFFPEFSAQRFGPYLWVIDEGTYRWPLNVGPHLPHDAV